MNIRNSRGPSGPPSGTPTVAGFAVDVMLLIDVTTIREDKQNVNQFITGAENPMFFNLATSKV